MFVVKFSALEIPSLPPAQNELGRRGEGHGLDEELVDAAGVLVDDQVQVFFDQLVQTEVSPVHDEPCASHLARSLLKYWSVMGLLSTLIMIS
jgi:hypothetical protein